MPGNKHRVAVVGTFDVENFGDVLFPIIAERELARRIEGCEVIPYSYHRRDPPSWPYPVRSLTRLADDLGAIDLVVVGGGHLVRFEREIAPGYAPPVPALHHPTGYWLMPTLLSSWCGVPVAWNAVGATPNPPQWARAVLAETVRSVDYLAVRDERTAGELRQFAPGATVHIVPDSAFGVRQVVDGVGPTTRRELIPEFDPSRPYVIVQPSPHFAVHRSWVDRFVGEATTRGYQILVLPISPALGDRSQVLELREDSLAPSTWPDPLAIVDLIRSAHAVLARSLHLSIVAACFGVPVHRHPSDPDPKYEIVTGMPGVFSIDSDVPLADASFGKTTPSPAIANREQSLHRHWDHVASLLGSARPPDRPRLQAMIGRLLELESSMVTA